MVGVRQRQQAVGQFALVVVVDVAEVGHAVAVELARLAHAVQVGAQDVAHRLGAVVVAALGDQPVELGGQFLGQRDGEAVHAGLSAGWGGVRG